MRTKVFLTHLILLVVIGLFVPVLSSVSKVFATPITEVGKFAASDGREGGNFGWWVDVDSQAIVVGATGMGDIIDLWGHRSGAVYLFRSSDGVWAEEDKLIACDAAISDNFGVRVAISGNTVVIGAQGKSAAYIFERDASSMCPHELVPPENGIWNQVAKLEASSPLPGGWFGWSTIGIDDDTIVIGDARDDSIANDSGAVYIFRRVGGTWTEEAILTASDAANGEMFGRKVAVSGDVVVIGSAYHDVDGFVDNGAVYVFRRNGNTWVEEAKLTSDNPGFDGFGEAAEIDGDTIVVGAWRDDTAYVFRYNGLAWTKETTLTGSGFGNSSTISGDTVATIGDSMIYLFQRSGNTWIEAGTVSITSSAPRLAISDDAIVRGDFYDNELGVSAGAAYVYSVGVGVLDIDFEGFVSDDQGKRFGVDAPLENGEYEGLDWAHDTATKIETWGSFTVQDSGAPGGNDSTGKSILGADDSQNWVKARASSVGKGAKITRLGDECFEFHSMKLYTQDHPAFIDEVTVTWRTCDATTTASAGLMLSDGMWTEVTAAELGIPEDTLLRAMWFNGASSNPDAAKFGLDDLVVEIVPDAL